MKTVVIFLTAAAALAQVVPQAKTGPALDQPINATLLGLVLDPKLHALRPIWGLPGGATVGASLNLGIDLFQVAVSPKQDYVLAAAGDDSSPVQIRTDRNSVEPLRQAGVLDRADLIGISPAGTSAALFQRVGRRIQVVAGLPDAPSVLAEMDISNVSGNLQRLAVSDDGRSVLASFEQDGLAPIYLLAAGSPPRLIPGIQSASAAAFLIGGRDALLADDLSNSVYLMHDEGGQASTIRIAADRDGIQNPVAVQVSNDNRRAFVASSQSRSVVIIDLVKGGTSSVSCRCVPAGLYRLAGDSVFRLTNFTDQPMWLLDSDGADPRVYFVPPPPPVSSEAGTAR